MLLLLAFTKQFEYVTGLGDSREIELGLDLRLARPFLRRRRRLRRKMLAYSFGFVVLYRARVCLLLSNANFFQNVQNGFTFYLKLSGQIIDSNLHPLRICLQVLHSLRDHNDLTLLFA